MKLSNPLINKNNEENEDLTAGIAVASPQSNQVDYIRVRPVPSLKDQSEITFNPETVDKTSTVIELRVEPKLKRLAVRSARLRLTATVEILDNDNRLYLIDSKTTLVIYPKRNNAKDLVFKYGRKIDNLDYNPLKFNVTLEYSLADCTDTYQKPCPVFDSEEIIEGQVTDKEGLKITKTMKKTLNFNLCKDPNSCQCKVGVEFNKTEQIIAGEKETVRLGNLNLSNSGEEASYNTNLTVTISSAAMLRLKIGTENSNCRRYNQTVRSCIIFVDENKTDEMVPIEVIPVSPIEPDVDDITVNVTVMDFCMGEKNTDYDKKLTIPVVHHWTLKPELTAGKDSLETWNYDSKETTLSKSLVYTITNEGPSKSSNTTLYVFLPNHRLIEKENTNVKFDNKICKVDNGNLQTPPEASASSGEHKMTISCTKQEDCLIYECPVNQMEKNRTKQLTVRYEFRSKEAQEESDDLTEFSVVTSVCVQPADESKDWSKICSKDVKTLDTHSEFIYYPATTLDIITSNWQIIVAVGAAILVLVSAILLAWKFDLFQRARIVRNLGEGEVEGVTNEASEPIELEMK